MVHQHGASCEMLWRINNHKLCTVPHIPENGRGGLYIIVITTFQVVKASFIEWFRICFLLCDNKNDLNMHILPKAVLAFDSYVVAFFFGHSSLTKYICTNSEMFQLSFVHTQQR